MGVVGNAIKRQNFSNTENSKHLPLWALGIRSGGLSFEVGKQRDQKDVYCFIEKKFMKCSFQGKA